MNFLTIDFETYYDKDFSLSKMTTEEYIRDDRFEAIGVSVKVGDEPAARRTRPKTGLTSLKWRSTLLSPTT